MATNIDSISRLITVITIIMITCISFHIFRQDIITQFLCTLSLLRYDTICLDATNLGELANCFSVLVYVTEVTMCMH